MLPSILSSFSARIDQINQVLFRFVSWLTLAMVVLTLVIVVLRYGFDMGWIAMQESVLYLHSLVFLVGAAHTLKVNEHVRVDIFYRRFSSQNKAKVDLFGAVFLSLPVNLFILAICWRYVQDSWRLLEGSGQSGGLPFVFVLKSFLLLFAIIMALQSVSQAIASYCVLFTKRAKNSEHFESDNNKQQDALTESNQHEARS